MKIMVICSGWETCTRESCDHNTPHEAKDDGGMCDKENTMCEFNDVYGSCVICKPRNSFNIIDIDELFKEIDI